jgi:hypothetical protein
VFEQALEAARHRAAGRAGRAHPHQRQQRPHRRLPHPATCPAAAARSPRRNRRATATARPAHRPAAGIHPRRDHDRAGSASRSAFPHAGKTAEITVGSDTYQITVEDGITLTAARTTSRDIKRHKASDYG